MKKLISEATFEELIAEIQGRYDGVTDAATKPMDVAEIARGAIVMEAKADVNELIRHGKGNEADITQGNATYKYQFYRVEFVVNNEKRTVVALVTQLYRNFDDMVRNKHRGIAKCHPDECFNAHIGKAIALRRALGLPVKEVYLNATEPTEINKGDVVLLTGDWTIEGKIRTVDRPHERFDGYWFTTGRWIDTRHIKVIDDSRG